MKRFARLLMVIMLSFGMHPTAALANVDTAMVAGASAEDFTISGGPLVTQANSTKYVKSKGKTSGSGRYVYVAKTAGSSFKAKLNSGSYCKYAITMSKNGKVRKVANGAYGIYITNGKYVFYSRVGKCLNPTGVYRYRHTLYRLDLSTGKRKRVDAGINCYADACDGKRLYYVKDRVEGVGGELRVLNLNTWKSKRVSKGLCNVSFSGGRIVAQVGSQNYGYAVYSFLRNGSGKKMLAESVGTYRVKKQKLYYIECNSEYRTTWYRVCCCSVTGTDSMALTSWTTSYSAAEAAYNGYAG